MRIWVVMLFGVAVVSAACAEDLREKYIGKNTCGPELQKTRGYAMRLDKTQAAYLDARVLDREKALMIIQYAKDGDKCGFVRDIVVSQNAKASFEFVCVECSDPSEVVIGTWSDDNNAASAQAIEAWRIDLAKLKFSPMSSRVTCFRETYHGYDEGEDLVSADRKEIGKKCTKINSNTVKNPCKPTR
jgi:hypothetical protein